MLATVNYIEVKGKGPLHLDKTVKCNGILIEGKVDIATESKLGVVRVINGNGLTITDGADGIEKAGVVSLALATETSAGAMSAEDKEALRTVQEELALIVPGGTVRFNGVIDEPDEGSTINYETVATDWEGVLWICSLKMFVAYKTTTTPVCGCSTATTMNVKFTYYVHWTEESLYMESPGEYGGLWKDKIYIGLGLTWQWASCDEQLVHSGADLWREATSEEIQAALDNFELVVLPELTGISGVEVEQEEPLTSSTYKDELGVVHISLGITEVTEEEIDKITGKED